MFQSSKAQLSRHRDREYKHSRANYFKGCFPGYLLAVLECDSPVNIFTARKRSFGQGNKFTGVCLSTGGAGYPSMPCRSHDQEKVYKQVHCCGVSVGVEAAYR